MSKIIPIGRGGISIYIYRLETGAKKYALKKFSNKADRDKAIELYNLIKPLSIKTHEFYIPSGEFDIVMPYLSGKYQLCISTNNKRYQEENLDYQRLKNLDVNRVVNFPSFIRSIEHDVSILNQNHYMLNYDSMFYLIRFNSDKHFISIDHMVGDFDMNYILNSKQDLTKRIMYHKNKQIFYDDIKEIFRILDIDPDIYSLHLKKLSTSLKN